jgi:hypothetical protein
MTRDEAGTPRKEVVVEVGNHRREEAEDSKEEVVGHLGSNHYHRHDDRSHDLVPCLLNLLSFDGHPYRHCCQHHGHLWADVGEKGDCGYDHDQSQRHLAFYFGPLLRRPFSASRSAHCCDYDCGYYDRKSCLFVASHQQRDQGQQQN